MTREERDALVLEALPTVRKLCHSYAAVHRLDFPPIVSDGYLAVIGLAEEYDATKGGNWLQFVAMRLKYRIVDIHRLRVGRSWQQSFDQRHSIHYPISVEYFTDDEGSEKWWPEPVDLRDTCDELAVADAFTHFLERLPSRTVAMVGLRLEGWTFQEIGDLYGVTESRVCQIFARLKPALERELVA